MELRFVAASGRPREVFEDALRRDSAASRLSWAYRGYYHVVRPLLPLPLRQRLQRRRGLSTDVSNIFPRDFMTRLVGALPEDGLELIHPWPGGADFALALTHDVESESGLRRCLDVAAIEEELGFRSSFNVVPFGYSIDSGITRELSARGFEIGIHGYNHDGRLFMSRRRFERRARRINQALRSYGAVGFRSPMAHRNLEWMQDLDFEYDGSCFDADPFQAMPGGVGSVWPFIAGRFVELPYTLPQDHTVFVVMGHEDAGLWMEKVDYLSRCSGLASMLTHPDYLDRPRRLDAYGAFLHWIRERGGYWHALPCEVARWWRRRDASAIDVVGGEPSVQGPAVADGAVPARLMAVDGFPVFRKLVSSTDSSSAARGGAPKEAEGVP